MPWNAIQASDIQVELLPQEVAMINTIQGSSGILATVLNTWVNKIRAMIEVGGNNLDVAGTVPDQLRPEIIAVVRWRWFSSMANNDLLSKQREEEFKQAMEKLNAVEKGSPKVEFPAAIPGGPSGQMQVARVGHRKTRGISGAV